MFFPCLLQHGMKLGQGSSSQMVLRHFEVTDTKSSTSSNPPCCFVSGCGDEELPWVLWHQLFFLNLSRADLVPLEFLLRLCFLADIKPTWATNPPHCPHVRCKQEPEVCKVPKNWTSPTWPALQHLLQLLLFMALALQPSLVSSCWSFIPCPPQDLHLQFTLRAAQVGHAIPGKILFPPWIPWGRILPLFFPGL